MTRTRTPVIYRKFCGETIAIFPQEPYDNHSGLITCYAHVGQHSSCSWDWVLSETTEPTDEDVAELHTELTRRGYLLSTQHQPKSNQFMADRSAVLLPDCWSVMAKG